MGLDINLFRVLKEKEYTKIKKQGEYDELTIDGNHVYEFLLEPMETNKNIIGFFNKFEKHISKKKVPIHYLHKTLDKLGYSPDDFIEDNKVKDNEIVYNVDYKWYTFGDFTLELKDGTEVNIRVGDMVLGEGDVDVLYVVDPKKFYQRKNMSTAFYQEYLSGCWYVAESNIPEEDEIYYAYTQDLVDKAGKYVLYEEEGYKTVKDVVLEENEFLDFDY